ncbi:efflux RND transporter periplasmic adaptor subunit [Novosphingobium sp.]|uniref:efflux RND transporter periplasmic adaptor subunit n=1 Tax=Novosphingobium sp. TaxID=1874826 RepID=UPI003B522EC5
MSDPHGVPDAAPPKGLGRVGLIVAGAALIVVAGGIYVRTRDADVAQTASDGQATPSVRLITPATGGASDELVLPGTMQAWNTAHIYAHVGGYVHAWMRDIGAEVGQNAPLATIDTPELDQQIIQARAALDRARAEAGLARSTAARWNDLLKSRAVSVQETDEKNADAKTHAAGVEEAVAALGRLLAEKSYATVRAPFAGVITQRTADIGDLVGPGATNQTPMFAMADERRIRVYVNVPQQYSAAMHSGLSATLRLPDYPDESFTATMTDQSHAIDQRSGSLQVQLKTDNPQFKLKPGGYAQVHFALPGVSTQLVVPSGVLVLREHGSQVGTVTDIRNGQGRVHLIPVVVGRDLGGKVEIASGLTAATKLIANPSDSISEGQIVRVESRRD